VNRWLLVALVALVVGLFAFGQGRALTREPVSIAPDAAPGWIEDGLAGLLLPFAAELAPADVSAQEGVGWRYEPTSGRLSIAAGSLATSVALRLPPDPDHEPQADAEPHERSRRIVELAEVASADTGAGEVTVRLVDPLDPDAAEFVALEKGRMSLPVPPEGAILELRCVGPRSFLLQ
jgi:hypothetical protein